MPLTQIEEFEPVNINGELLTADGTDLLPLVDSRGYRLRIDSLQLTNGDSVDHIVTFKLAVGGGPQRQLGTMPVPARAGYDGIPAVVNAIGSVFQQGTIVMAEGDVLAWSLDAAVGSGTAINAYLGCGKV